MIELPPKFTDSKYFKAEPEWHLEKDAPDSLKKEFEVYMNSEKKSELYKRVFPDMKSPFCDWTGKIVDRG